MINRRNFLAKSALFTAGTIAMPYLFSCKSESEKKIGLQLYTVRDQLNLDRDGTLDKIADIGYKTLEGAGYNNRQFYNLKPADFKTRISLKGLRMVSTHIPPELIAIENNNKIADHWLYIVEDALNAGAEYVVIAYLRPEDRVNLDDYRDLAEKFNIAAEVCKNAGIQFAYHNHDFEFFEYEGKTPYDVLLNETDNDLVKMELDIYWVIKAGFDPVDYINNYPGRFPLWHVKDMDDTKQQFFTEVGNGIIDFERIFNVRRKAGLKYFFVEQDICKDYSPIESIRISYEYLRNAKYL